MNRLYYCLVSIALCLMLSGLFATAKETTTIKDDLGRDVVISSPAERVVFSR